MAEKARSPDSIQMETTTKPSDESADAHTNGENDQNEKKTRCNCLKKASNAIIRGLETMFYKIGKAIGRHPWAFMLGSVVFALIMVPGAVVFLVEEEDSTNLWVPVNSQALIDKEFVETNFQTTAMRFEGMIVEADNVLTPAVIQAMLDIDIAVKAISKAGSYDWNSLCFKIGGQCLSNSLLELWSFNEATIRGLSQADILTAVNTITVSPVYYNAYDVTSVLGEITKDSSGQIIGAKATSMSFALHSDKPITASSPASDEILEWEKAYIDIGAAGRQDIKQLYYYAGRSFGDEGGSNILKDLYFLFAGFALVFVFACIVLGRFTHVHHRIYMTMSGLACIGLSVAVSYGFCSYIGLKYGPVHSILPFLFLGIGVDDMFVICQSLDSLGSQTEGLSLQEKMGLTLKHAGVAITVTSFTDVLAFAVGSTTVLPALRSFCGFAAVGILAIFIFQVTFLTPCLAYDLRRRNASRNACCCCYIHHNYEPRPCTEKGVVQKVFDNHYGPFLVKLPVKIVVTIVALGLVGVCIWGTINLKQDFDFTWFLPFDSYPRKYFDASDKYFPQSGVTAKVYFANIDYYGDYSTLESIHNDVKNDKYVTDSSVDSWFISYRTWLSTTTDPAVTALLDGAKYPTSAANFYSILSTKFLTSASGARFQADIKTNTDLTIKASRIAYQFNKLDDAQTEVKAMDSVRGLLTDFKYSIEQCFTYTTFFLGFETNKVIQRELYRNLGLAFLCVLIMTLLLLADILACLYVCFCIIMSLVDVGGCMWFWGLTIDTVTSINLIIAIGLTVDYSAHIAHAFMVTTGGRNERVKGAMSIIGPAVFYGGFSTFLAFILLTASQSYVFTVFFKVFFLVVLFGMFHGLMFLPVILSWIGPSAYQTAESLTGYSPDTASQSNDEEKTMGVANGHVANGDLPPDKRSPTPEANGHVNPALDMESEKESKQNGITPIES